MQNSPSLSNASHQWFTTPRSFDSAMRQPPSGCAQYVPRVSVSFMKRPTPVRDTTCWIALLASSRTRTDCSDSS